MPGWLIQLIIAVVSAAVSYFASRPKTPDAQEFQGPIAEAGNPIPVWWGTAMVSPNTVLFTNVAKAKRKQWFYFMSAQHLLGWGIVNEILDISFADKSCRNHVTGTGQDVVLAGSVVNAGTPSEFPICGNNNAHATDSIDPMFGGDDQAGGVGVDTTSSGDDLKKGQLCMYWGFDDATAQPLDPFLASSDAYGATCSRWPRFAYLRMGHQDGHPFYIAAASATPPAMKVLCRRTAWWDGVIAGDPSPLGQSASEATIRYDANPAEILYDLLTHKGYGLGRDPASIDVDSFAAAAVTLREEVICTGKTGFGISVLLTQATDAGTVIRGILDCVMGTLATNPLTGKLRLKLVRADYVVADLPQLHAGNTWGVKFSPGTWAETFNEVSVTYRRLINTSNTRDFVDDIVTAQDLANFQATGRIRALKLDMPYVTDADVAALCAARARRAHSSPLARYAWTMNREGFALMQGDAVHAVETAFNADLILRVTQINYGSLEQGEIVCEGMEDVFGIAAPSVSASTTGFVEPTVTSTDGSGGSVPSAAAGIVWGEGFY